MHSKNGANNNLLSKHGANPVANFCTLQKNGANSNIHSNHGANPQSSFGISEHNCNHNTNKTMHVTW
jgi:hypothetical protein